MPLYKVTLHETVEYTRSIYASSEEEAESTVCDDWAELENPEDLYTAVGMGVELVYIEEIE